MSATYRILAVRPAAIALALAVSACANLPAELANGARKAAPRPSSAVDAAAVTAAPSAPATTAPSVAVAPTQAPSPLPSLGLVLEGVVTVDAASLIANKLVEPAGTGVRLLGEHGAGLISDKGYGIIANNSGALVANNGGALTGKVKYALADAAATPAAAAGAHDLVPIAGIVVKAVSLRDGTLLAGPVATDAQGHYHLGFIDAPQTNLRIVAAVNDLAADPRYSYETFTVPTSAPVMTNDSTRAVADYLVRILAGRLQHSIDARIAGEPISVSTDGVNLDANSQKLVSQFNDALAKVDPLVVAILDKDGTDQPGTFSRNFAERVLSFARLDHPPFQDIYAVTEDLRRFEASLPQPANPPLLEQIVKLASYGPDSRNIPGVLEKYGMPADRAQAILARMTKDGDDISVETAQVALDNYRDALGPQFAGLQIPTNLIPSPQVSTTP